MRLSHFGLIHIAVASLVASYLTFGIQNAPAHNQAVALAGKSDRVAVMAGEEVNEQIFSPKIVRLEKYYPSANADVNSAKWDLLSYLADYAYSEVPPEQKPANTILNALRDIPIGTPVEEIQRASELTGLDFNFMKAVAKIESDFDPKQRSGSYMGLFQLSKYEFAAYGSGEILNARDNAIAAAYKFATTALLFELNTHKKATYADLYLIHQ